MGGSIMSSIMLMATMVVLSWRSSMMERHTILNMLGMDMVDMCRAMKIIIVKYTMRNSLIFLTK